MCHKINKNNDENKMFAPAPLFRWVWDKKCLISKTLYGPQICVQVEFERGKKIQKKKKNTEEEGKEVQGKFRINFNELFFLVQLSL